MMKSVMPASAQLAGVRHAYRLGRQTALTSTLSADYVALRRAWQLFYREFCGYAPVPVGVQWLTPGQTLIRAYENGLMSGQVALASARRPDMIAVAQHSDELTENGDAR